MMYHTKICSTDIEPVYFKKLINIWQRAGSQPVCVCVCVCVYVLLLFTEVTLMNNDWPLIKDHLDVSEDDA